MCMAKANPIGFDRLSLGRGVSRVAFSSFIGRYMNYQHIRSIMVNGNSQYSRITVAFLRWVVG